MKAVLIKAPGDAEFQGVLYLVDPHSSEGLMMLHTSKYTYQVDSQIPCPLPAQQCHVVAA